MSGYAEFTNKPSVTAGDALNPTTQINNPAQGVQDEFELERGDAFFNGVASGYAMSASTLTVTTAAGRAYVAGKRYEGSDTLSMSGEASGTYNILLDSSDDTTPFKAQTASVTSTQLLIGTVVFNGSTITSSDSTVRVRGLLSETRDVHVSGTTSTGIKAIIPIQYDTWIDDVEIILGTSDGTTGSVTVDVHLGADGSKGTSIFATQSRRPTLAAATAAYTIGTSGEPDGDRAPDAGEHLTVEVDAVFSAGTSTLLGTAIHMRQRVT